MKSHKNHLFLAIFYVVSLALPACGARVIADVDEDSGLSADRLDSNESELSVEKQNQSDSGLSVEKVDGSQSTPPDSTILVDSYGIDIQEKYPIVDAITPMECGSGPCVTGNKCTNNCVACTCNEGHFWSCKSTGLCATCPVNPPLKGEECGPSGLQCNFTLSCGAATQATCVDGGWSVLTRDCANSCPPTQPSVGTPCFTKLACGYESGCGTINTWTCENKNWKAIVPTCGNQCPTAKPAENSPCNPATTTTCSYSIGLPHCVMHCSCNSNGKFSCKEYEGTCSLPPMK